MDISLGKKVYLSLVKNLKLEGMLKLRIATLAVIVMKTIVFLALLESVGAGSLAWSNISLEFWYVYLSFAAIIFSAGYLFSGSRQIKFYLVFNILYTVMLILDLWYFRVNRDFIGMKNIFFKGTFNPLAQSLVRGEPIDLIFIVDIVLIILWIKTMSIENKRPKSKLKFSITFILAVIGIVISYNLINIIGISRWDKKLFKMGWSPLMSVRAPGPLGYHLFEAYNTVGKVLAGVNPSEIKEVENWLVENKETLEDNEYKGMLKGKNVIFLQLESFENFIINRKVNGKEITPFLNKLTQEGLYFNNIYEQNNGGNSIDCDFMVNTSILPLGDSITATSFGEVVYPNSMPRILKSEGYTTAATHAEDAAEFNWTELHKNGFGVDILWDLAQYKYEETVGYGLSDRSFLTQLSGKIKNLPQPFYLFAPTMSNHGPFNIDEKYRELGLPQEIDESYLGGYFESALYTDRQIEMFFGKLEEAGILEDTVIVMYGDHAGVHKYYNEDIQKLSYDGDWWKEYDHKIPMIIYSKGITPKIFETHGGQIDILPTVAYLLGVEDSKYRDSVMGRVLVNTNRNATVIKGNIIKGQVESEEEKEHLLKGYDIGSKIIKN